MCRPDCPCYRHQTFADLRDLFRPFWCAGRFRSSSIAGQVFGSAGLLLPRCALQYAPKRAVERSDSPPFGRKISFKYFFWNFLTQTFEHVWPRALTPSRDTFKVIATMAVCANRHNFAEEESDGVVVARGRSDTPPHRRFGQTSSSLSGPIRRGNAPARRLNASVRYREARARWLQEMSPR